LPTVWINRLGEDAEPVPDVELHSLTGLGRAGHARMNIRPLTEVDLDAVARLAAEDETVLHGRESRLGTADVRGWLTRTDLANDSWLYEDDGRPSPSRGRPLR